MITFSFDKSGRLNSPPELFVGYSFIQIYQLNGAVQQKIKFLSFIL